MLLCLLPHGGGTSITLDDLFSNARETFTDNYDPAEGQSDYTTDDTIREIADQTVPIHHGDLLEVAMSALWLATEEPEIMAFNGENTAVNAIAGNIYEAIVADLYEYKNELDEDYQLRVEEVTDHLEEY
jgi:hypothetical protein